MRTCAVAIVAMLASGSFTQRVAVQPSPPPIIDMHMHAEAADSQGPPPMGLCPGQVFPLPVLGRPWPDMFLEHFKKPPCAQPIWSPTTDLELMNRTFAVMQRRNVFGDGTQTRSFTYISDLVDGIIRLMLSKENDPVNIGNPREMTLKALAETIVRMTGSNSKLVYRPLPEDDPKVRQPDITRARTLLGWEPKVNVEDGLKITIEYFRTKI